jgi:hypothetical protein
MPSSAQYEDHLALVRALSMTAQPDVCGINANVALIRDKLDTTNILQRIIKSQVKLEYFTFVTSKFNICVFLILGGC